MKSKNYFSLAITVLALLIVTPLYAKDPKVIGKTDGSEIVTVRPKTAKSSKQNLPRFEGISGKLAGSRAISMQRILIPPGGQAKAHVHKGYETAVYIIQGAVETRYGVGLKKSILNQAGHFLYIPPDLPHQPRNISDTEPAIAIVARTDPNEQESVVPYPSK